MAEESSQKGDRVSCLHMKMYVIGISFVLARWNNVALHIKKNCMSWKKCAKFVEIFLLVLCPENKPGLLLSTCFVSMF